MAMNGSFAGGLADGMRNGMAIGNAYNRAAEERRAREVDKKLAAALEGPDGNRQQAPVGLEKIQVPEESVTTGPALGEVRGLQPVPVIAPATPDADQGLAPSTVTLGDFAPGAQFGNGTAVRPGPTALAAEKKSPDIGDFLGGGEFGQIADGLTRAYRKALELGEPGRAMELLANRERYVGQHREQAFSAAQSRYQLTGDPNSYVPFVNRFMPGGIEVTSINKRSEQAGGAPLYDFVGVDTATGKPVQQPISEHMLQSFVQSISDPKAQQAMVAKQYQDLQALSMARQKAQIDANAKVDVAQRTHSLDMEKATAGQKGQVLDTPGGVVVVDPRSGQAKPVVGSDGKPVMGRASSSGGAVIGYSEDGSPIYSPQKLKPIPPQAMAKIQDNQANLRKVDLAIAALAENPDAVGLKNKLPDALVQRGSWDGFSDGVGTRALIADLGSLIVHDRSGAAVTAAEFPRLAPFIPQATDSAETARKKLERFKAEYEAVQSSFGDIYGPDNGYQKVAMPKAGGSSAGEKPAAKSAAPSTGAVGRGYSNLWGQ